MPDGAEHTGASVLVDTLPEFALEDLGGEIRSIHGWEGDALVINFWATWCAPCLREIPLLKEFQDANGSAGVQVVGIAVDRLEAVQAFAEDMGFNYPVLVGQLAAMEAAAEVRARILRAALYRIHGSPQAHPGRPSRRAAHGAPG